MPLKDAQIFFQVEGAVSKIEVFTKDADQVRSMRPEILQAVGPMVRILDWQRVNSSFFTALQVERNVMFLILTLIIIVAAFKIISSQVMLRSEEHTSEIQSIMRIA